MWVFRGWQGQNEVGTNLLPFDHVWSTSISISVVYSYIICPPMKIHQLAFKFHSAWLVSVATHFGSVKGLSEPGKVSLVSPSHLLLLHWIPVCLILIQALADYIPIFLAEPIVTFIHCPLFYIFSWVKSPFGSFLASLFQLALRMVQVLVSSVAAWPIPEADIAAWYLSLWKIEKP
jgi:hypothetical protein